MNYFEQASSHLTMLLIQSQRVMYNNMQNMTVELNRYIQITYSFLLPYYRAFTVSIGYLMTKFSNGLFFIANVSVNTTSYVFKNLLMPILNTLYDGLTYAYKNFLRPVLITVKDGIEHLAKYGYYTLKYVYDKLLSPMLRVINDHVEQLASLCADALEYLYSNFLSPMLTIITDRAEQLAKFCTDAMEYLYTNFLAPILIIIKIRVEKIAKLCAYAMEYLYTNFLVPILTVIKDRAEQLASFCADAMEYLYINFFEPILLIAQNCIDMGKEFLGMVVDGVELLGKTVLSILGLPVYLYSKFTDTELISPTENHKSNIRDMSLIIGTWTVMLVGMFIAKQSNLDENNTIEDMDAAVLGLIPQNDDSSVPCPFVPGFIRSCQIKESSDSLGINVPNQLTFMPPRLVT